MAITHADIGVDETLGRRILVHARLIAPCLDSFGDDSEEKKNAIAILKGVIDELPAAGSRRVRSKGRNGTTITFEVIESAFTASDRGALASLCASSAAGPGLPLGSFPRATGIERVWPEGSYS